MEAIRTLLKSAAAKRIHSENERRCCVDWKLQASLRPPQLSHTHTRQNKELDKRIKETRNGFHSRKLSSLLLKKGNY